MTHTGKELILNILTGEENILETTYRKPELIIFADPNGSGKSTITKMAKTVGKYINADEIKKTIFCTDLEAAQIAEKLRNSSIDKHEEFTFETVLSTPRNLNLLKRAKEEGYFIRGIYVLTANPYINVARVKARVSFGGHDVPEEKILSRYDRALELIPHLLKYVMLCIFTIILFLRSEYSKSVKMFIIGGRTSFGVTGELKN